MGYSTVDWCIDGNGSIIRGFNTVPLDSDTLDPTQCELAGIYTILRIVDFMVTYFQLDKGLTEIGCDYKGGLVRTLLREVYSEFHFVAGSHLDLVNSINTITRNEKIEIIGRHISDHQDYYCVYDQFDWWGNVMWTWIYLPSH